MMSRIRWKICVYQSNPLIYSNKSCRDVYKIVILPIFLDSKFTDKGIPVRFSWYLPKWNLIISEASQYVSCNNVFPPHDYYCCFLNETPANKPQHCNFAFTLSHLSLILFYVLYLWNLSFTTSWFCPRIRCSVYIQGAILEWKRLRGNKLLS